MHRPFREQRGVTTDDVLEALKSQRQGVREFAGVQARPASSSNLPVPQAAPPSASGRCACQTSQTTSEFVTAEHVETAESLPWLISTHLAVTNSLVV